VLNKFAIGGLNGLRAEERPPVRSAHRPVRNRVKLGGHAVPEEKIVDRYRRSLALLSDAIRLRNRAYIFDNSGENKDHTWLAEITEGQHLELKTNQIPSWFRRSVLDKVRAPAA
jgi:predicted ABC-type ATPase